jgi:L-aspartate oxidase
MARYHPLADLAPRDIVSRVILDEMQQTAGKEVYLDLTALDSHYLQKRFPTIYKTCLDYKIDISRNLIPVRPSAHYAMGGVRTDYWGRTGRESLYACGEVAGTGLHGANRLASNSLLEGVVFGARAGKAVLETLTSKPLANLGEKNERFSLESTGNSAKIGRPRYPDVLEGTRQQLRRLMWDKVGIIRSRDTLEKAREQMNAWGYLEGESFFTREELEVRNMLIVARTITQSALEREESRGTHYRKDFPCRDDIHWKKHIVFRKGLSYFLSLENQHHPSEIDKLPR